MLLTKFMTVAESALFPVVVLSSSLDCVDPLIGTASKRRDSSNAAAMVPYAGVPFGMWQWSPMTRLSELGKVAYCDSDRRFIGFIGTRKPAPWMGEYGQLAVMPQIGVIDCTYATRGIVFDRNSSAFTPYVCRIALTNGIVAECTASSRCGMMRFSYPSNSLQRVVLDVSREFVGEFSDRRSAHGFADIGDPARRRVFAWNDDRADAKLGPPLKNCRAKFIVEFSRPWMSAGIYEGIGEVRNDGYRATKTMSGTTRVEADVCGAYFEFAASSEPLVVKVAQSMIDMAQAGANMKRECGYGFDFDAMAEHAREEWRRRLSKIDIEADDNVRKIFYTAMYHTLLFPREFSEYGRYYSAFDDKVHEGESYTAYSLWDTYRAEHALLTLVAPERVDGMMTALLQMYREGGWLPKWPNPAYTGIMVGGPAEIVLAQAYVNGFRGFDLNLAYEAVKHNAMVPSVSDRFAKWTGREAWTGAPEGRGGLSSYMELGYVAADLTTESVSRTLDFCHDDLAAAVLADAVGKTDEAAFFRQRAKNYKNLWEPSRKMFWPRNANGTWKHKPKYHWSDGDYTEQSAETAVWGVPFDVPGIVALLGGTNAFEFALDDYFCAHFFTGRADGLTFHENETTHHIAYLYAAIGRHDKCAKTVRRILDTSYSAERWGMEGNDDCGAMSAWYILSALGFYPLDPTSGEYIIGSPCVKSAAIHIGRPFKPAVFNVVVHGQSADNRLVKSVKLNGRVLHPRHIRHSDIVAGGVLEFEMEDGGSGDGMR